jgi:hypothetical protein
MQGVKIIAQKGMDACECPSEHDLFGPAEICPILIEPPYVISFSAEPFITRYGRTLFCVLLLVFKVV